MVNRQLIDPESIVVVGASNNITKPGGKLFHNIRTGTFKGKLYALNPKEETIQGLPSLQEVRRPSSYRPGFPGQFLLHFALRSSGSWPKPKIPGPLSLYRPDSVKRMRRGCTLRRRLWRFAGSYEAALIGPNCIGVMTPSYQGVFTLPIPRLDPQGCDFISGSGATAVFIMESGLQKGTQIQPCIFGRKFSTAGCGRCPAIF